MDSLVIQVEIQRLQQPKVKLTSYFFSILMLKKLTSTQIELHSSSKDYRLFHRRIQCRNKTVLTYQEKLLALEVLANKIPQCKL